LSSVDPLEQTNRLTATATLPDKVLFLSGGTLVKERDAAAMAESSSVGGPSSAGSTRLLAAGQGAGLEGATSVADPILFYPDGTSATARIILGNSRNYFVVVELRGLTGIARSSDLLSAEELPP
jgi:hypothetical protein